MPTSGILEQWPVIGHVQSGNPIRKDRSFRSPRKQLLKTEHLCFRRHTFTHERDAMSPSCSCSTCIKLCGKLNKVNHRHHRLSSKTVKTSLRCQLSSRTLRSFETVQWTIEQNTWTELHNACMLIEPKQDGRITLRV